MSTTEAPSLTRKQQQVFELLERGIAPSEIAKRLKITSSGVYGHMRNMRAAGITLPNERLENGSSTASTTMASTLPPLTTAVASAASTNGTPEPEDALRAALDAGNGRIGEIEVHVGELHEKIAQLTSERERLEARTGALDQALQALA